MSETQQVPQAPVSRELDYEALALRPDSIAFREAFPFPDLVDNTMVGCFDACERKFLLEHIMHLSPLAISPDLHAGGAFAKGLEVARRFYYQHHTSQDEALLWGVRALIKEYDMFEPTFGHPKTCEAMIGALDDYLREYPFATDQYKPFQLTDGSPAVEFTFSIPTLVPHPVTRIPILYAGRFDMLGQHETGFLAIVDEKTTKNFIQTWANQWGMRGQFLGYTYAAQQHGYNVSSALIRGIAIQKTQYKHLQCLEEYGQWQIDRWWKSMNMKLARAVDRWVSGDFLPSYGDACGSYGGCPMMSACTTSRPEEAYGGFQKRVWSPLARDPSWPKEGLQYQTVRDPMLDAVLGQGEGGDSGREYF